MSKILIQASPRTGKSTLLDRITNEIRLKRGFLTKEVCSANQRTGFKVVSSNGDEEVIASRYFATGPQVSKYRIDIPTFELVLEPLFEVQPDELLYIDEIGEMQFHSTVFQPLVEKYISYNNPFLGTLSLVYSNDFTRTLRERRDISVIQLTLENRDEIYEFIRKEFKL